LWPWNPLFLARNVMGTQKTAIPETNQAFARWRIV